RANGAGGPAPPRPARRRRRASVRAPRRRGCRAARRSRGLRGARRGALLAALGELAGRVEELGDARDRERLEDRQLERTRRIERELDERVEEDDPPAVALRVESRGIADSARRPAAADEG